MGWSLGCCYWSKLRRLGQRIGLQKRRWQMTTQAWAVAVVLAATVFGSFGSIYLKKGAADLEFNLKKLLKNKKLFYGITLFIISTILSVSGLKGGELSVLYPLAALSYVWICILSMKMLKEKMGFWKWTGVILIVAGVGLIGYGSAI
ncbi:MAG: hypothetical protein FJY77_03015 [Candidatus Altiarchaeales archaeon]|nr:hypothetical protein [Candidatus Altiarchaeales archaeon]